MMEQRELIRLQKELLNPEKMKKCQEQKRKHRSVRGSSVNEENLGHHDANTKGNPSFRGFGKAGSGCEAGRLSET